MNPSDHWAGYETTQDLENFRNNGGSAGLDGGSKVGRKEDMADDMRCGTYYQILKDVVGEDFLDKVWHNEKGNPEGLRVDGRILTRSDIQNAYNAWRLAPYLRHGMHLVEIGPGFGGLAAMLKRLKEVSIDLIDLPDQRQIQQYYLSEFDGIRWIEPEQAQSADIVINIRSMMEMNLEQVKGYFKIINKQIKPDYFYCVNRYIKRTTLKDYPFNDDWEALISTPLLFESGIHEFMLKPGEGIKRTLQGIPVYRASIENTDALLSVPNVMQEFEAYSVEDIYTAQNRKG